MKNYKDSKLKLFLDFTLFALAHPLVVLKAIKSHKASRFISITKNDAELADQKLKLFLNKNKYSKIKREKYKFKRVTKIRNFCFNNYKKPLVSIIIPVYNHFRFTYSCLLCIQENVDYDSLPYEIIVINDNSNDLTTKLKDYVKGIKIINNNTNLGFLLSVNKASKIANGEYIYFLNNDTNPQKDFLKELVNYLKEHSDVGIVGSKLVYKNGFLQEAGCILFKDGSACNYGNGQNPSLPQFNYIKEVDYVSGASLMIRKKIWEKIGGFDVRFAPAYCEDSDLCLETRKAGYKVVYVPASIVVHFEGASNGKNTNKGMKRFQLINQQKLKDKWKVFLTKKSKNEIDIYRYRDLSNSKKIVLVIDHYVPEFDKDAGSKTVFSYLLLFSKMGYKVVFVGDNFNKTEPYTSMLQKEGIEVLYGNIAMKNFRHFLRENGMNFDYIILNRPHISIKYIDYLKTVTKAKICYYGHDLHMLRLEREYQLKKQTSILKELNYFKEIEEKLFKLSDAIYYPSEFEIEYIKQKYKISNVKILQPYIYKTKRFNKKNNRSGLLFVGGFRHEPNVDACLWFAKDIFPNVVKKMPNIVLHIVGSYPPESIKKLASKNICIHPDVSEDNLVKYYLNSKIFICPLRYGAGIKGKILDAMYYSLPIITTSCGGEGIPNFDKSMLITDEATKFSYSIINLYSDEMKQKKLVENAKKIIDKHFSINSAKTLIKKEFK